MVDLWGAAVALGVAGLDPTGALLAVAALAVGTRERAVVIASIVALVVVALLGTALSVTVGRSLHRLHWGDMLPTGRGSAVLGLPAGGALLMWAVRRSRRPGTDPVPGRTARTATTALVGLVGLTLLSAAVDPAFLGLALVLGRQDEAVTVVAAQAIYTVVSQAPLVLLVGAVLAGRHGRAVAVFQRAWTRVRPVMDRAATAALVLAGVALVADSLWWFATGRFVVTG